MRFVPPLVLLLVLVSGTVARAQDTEALDRVLSAHVHGGRVDYAGIAADSTARADLRRFVESLASMPESAGLAHWLNAYNGLVLDAVVAHLPLRSVRDVPGFFDRARHRVAGRERTLDDLENQIIRPRFHDARVHVALVCGASSCPPLPARAFRQANLDDTLTRLARQFVASTRHVDVVNGRLRLSELMFWFREDFERDAGSVLGWLRRYDAGGRLTGLPDNVPLDRIPYRWDLNARRP